MTTPLAGLLNGFKPQHTISRDVLAHDHQWIITDRTDWRTNFESTVTQEMTFDDLNDTTVTWIPAGREVLIHIHDTCVFMQHPGGSLGCMCFNVASPDTDLVTIAAWIVTQHPSSESTTSLIVLDRLVEVNKRPFPMMDVERHTEIIDNVLHRLWYDPTWGVPEGLVAFRRLWRGPATLDTVNRIWNDVETGTMGYPCCGLRFEPSYHAQKHQTRHGSDTVWTSPNEKFMQDVVKFSDMQAILTPPTPSTHDDARQDEAIADRDGESD